MNYKIRLSRLQDDSYSYNFEVNDDFLKSLQQNILEKASVKIQVEVIQSPSNLVVTLKFKGTIGLICDRSLKPFDYPLSKTSTLIFKFSDHFEELADDVYLIEKGTQEIDLATHIFDLIALEIPLKKLHPDFLKTELQDDDNAESDLLVYTTQDANAPYDTTMDVADPRWEILKKLKDTF